MCLQVIYGPTINMSIAWFLCAYIIDKSCGVSVVCPVLSCPSAIHLYYLLQIVHSNCHHLMTTTAIKMDRKNREKCRVE